ncbi:hypothetical protein DVH26_31205 [Paenibacillus sp. H1-7]|nr:hypothetical protein DVH26_31205 [Paenibacillus sp. H1-7]
MSSFLYSFNKIAKYIDDAISVTPSFFVGYYVKTQACPVLDSLFTVTDLFHAPDLIELFGQIVRSHNREPAYRKHIERSLLCAWILQFHQLKQHPYPVALRIRHIIDQIERNPAFPLLKMQKAYSLLYKQHLIA